jgi:hypothetical protein
MGKILSDQILAVRKLVPQNFAFFENKYNKLYCVNSGIFHAASSVILYFFTKRLGEKKMKDEKTIIVRVEKKSVFRKGENWSQNILLFFEIKKYAIKTSFTL